MKRIFSAEELAADQLTLLTTGQFINVSGERPQDSIIYPLTTMVPMQFTGLHDKNEKEIYEGDIWRGEPMDGDYGKEIAGPVEFNAPKFGVRTWAGVIDVWFHLGEVIGNIYDDPELLRT